MCTRTQKSHVSHVMCVKAREDSSVNDLAHEVNSFMLHIL